MKKNVEVDGVLWLTISNRKQLYEFKKIFARSVNLSNVDSNRWKLYLRKVKKNDETRVLKLYFDNELIDKWAVIKFNPLHVSLKNLETLNEMSEKYFFKEEWFYGVKDEEALLSMIGSVDNSFFGVEPYPTVISKATYYWYTIATKQMFNNGNKRTALLTALFYLQINGFEFKIKDKEMLYNISFLLANKQMSKEQLADYISKNTLIDFDWMNNILKEYSSK